MEDTPEKDTPNPPSLGGLFYMGEWKKMNCELKAPQPPKGGVVIMNCEL